MLLWVPVSVLQQHGYVMTDDLCQPSIPRPAWHKLPSYTAPTVLVRLGLPGPPLQLEAL